jgi:hypothetical protein
MLGVAAGQNRRVVTVVPLTLICVPRCRMARSGALAASQIVGAALMPDPTWRQRGLRLLRSRIPMTYTDGFTSVHNSFIVSEDFELDEKLVLIWLASKPADWLVRQDQLQAELGIGRDRAKRILRDLRAKGAITKPDAVRNTDGTFRRPPSELAAEVRASIRYVSAGRTEGLESRPSVAPPIYKGKSNKGNVRSVPAKEAGTEALRPASSLRDEPGRTFTAAGTSSRPSELTSRPSGTSTAAVCGNCFNCRNRPNKPEWCDRVRNWWGTSAS